CSISSRTRRSWPARRSLPRPTLQSHSCGNPADQSEGHSMERMLVVILDDEHKAYEAADALQDLNENGAVGLKGAWVLTRQSDGSVGVVKTDDTLPEGSMGGAVIGGLAGLFGGPVGLAVGATSGLVI